ncbi:bifunctional transcriptional activator/DNA repair enzyme AdaA [Halobacillus litoralis]|uniref:HTH araC/xylS-type domain-containing protein n=1 Tax=Halobacillus litoralis TaxID=45668 RepID=A0A410ME24_9BACI|nr:Ada metal-binding domain-containing protein [Halobacillus litoralis]QAS52989.1 hypothetical protein HLI_12700 [Halobacillus litoralis]
MNEEYWNAIQNCDVNFDDEFYYAVKSTRIFCRPSCKSKLPKKQNVRIFLNKTDPIKNGYRPCKRCRPDLQKFLPLQEEMVDKAISFINIHFKEDLNLKNIAQSIHVNEFYLLRVFSRKVGISPTQYVRKKRIEEAQRLIKTTDHSITAISLNVGFNSPSHFSVVFKKAVGKPPSQFRNKEI